MITPNPHSSIAVANFIVNRPPQLDLDASFVLVSYNLNLSYLDRRRLISTTRMGLTLARTAYATTVKVQNSLSYLNLTLTRIEGGDSKWRIPPASRLYPGAMPVYSPYFYWQLPRKKYAGAKRIGENFSTPKAGSCKEGTRLGDAGCRWRRHEAAQVIHGKALLELGWNATIVQHWPLHSVGPNSTTQLETNLPVFAKAWDALSKRIARRCCGC